MTKEELEHNHEEYEADTDMLGMVDEEDEMGAWNYERNYSRITQYSV